MSKILREPSTAGFLESLQAAGDVREALLRRSSPSPTARDLRRDSGRQEGFAIGQQEGYAADLLQGEQKAHAETMRQLEDATRSQIDRLTTSVTQLLLELESQREEFFKQAEQSLADLSIEIARRAIGEEVAISRERVVEIAKQALAEATEATSVRIRVNPADGSILESRIEEIKGHFAHIDTIEVVEDRSVGFGCKLETDLGLIDARVEDYLVRLADRYREAV